LKGKGDTGDIGEEGGEFDVKAEEEYGGEEGGGGEGVGSAKMGHVVGELSIEGHVSGNKRKDMSSTEKVKEDGRG
jgi:hypothetical protein